MDPRQTDPSNLLRVDRDARGVLTLTLQQATRFNVLSADMLQALQRALDQAEQDPGLRVLVLAAEGPAFCAGHDLKAMAQPGLTQADHQALFDQCTRFMNRLQALPVPVVARVQGLATAAGCQLVAQCDLAVASTEARFATSGIRYGLFCATPAVPLSRNLPAKKALEMLFTGDFIGAEEALASGLVNRVAAPEELDAVLATLLNSLLDKPRAALAWGKALFYRQREAGQAAAYQMATQTMAVNMMDPAAQEGALAFLEKRAPVWPLSGE
ncbi:enoyl-CoA hydratase [Curvibacter sp. HBC61]|uniref:Enoyl-CoA hydratase domain-containing protein 3, mitochondrial n=1 Tax=Curvibacter cyanobacteriorum TaxID=3026422 RepID=A0ABT5MW93_9BURK|nr:enoyl-CoA hydratase [Curvibacter sp. HBC61]MDD0837008.1 enoyl-CoA hydratase [Curvibacter sp. HBC61]